MSSLAAFESCQSMPAIHVSPPVIPIALRLWFKRSECTSTCKSTDRRPEWSSLTLTPTRTRESPLACDKGHDLRAPCRLSVSRGQSTLPYLLLLSMPRHTSSLSSSHALSSTLRRKTLSRLLSASPISTQKGLSCPRYTRYPASQPIPITSGPIQFPPTNPEAAGEKQKAEEKS
jgi:hypothetical protein